MRITPITHTCKQSKLSIQKGVGLIEVLVALVILSVGLLGIASLYVTALQAKTTSLSRMKAVILAQDMADRIRANPSGLNNYALTISTTKTALPNPDCSTTTVICSAAQIALYDKYQWDNMIYDTTRGMNLPGLVSRSITVTAATSTTPATVTIDLIWQEKNSGDLTYTLQIQV